MEINDGSKVKEKLRLFRNFFDEPNSYCEGKYTYKETSVFDVTLETIRTLEAWGLVIIEIQKISSNKITTLWIHKNTSVVESIRYKYLHKRWMIELRNIIEKGITI